MLRLFLDRERRGRRLEPTGGGAKEKPFSPAEKATLGVALGMVALRLTEAGHSLEIATVSVLGAVALTAPGIGVLA